MTADLSSIVPAQGVIVDDGHVQAEGVASVAFHSHAENVGDAFVSLLFVLEHEGMVLPASRLLAIRTALVRLSNVVDQRR